MSPLQSEKAPLQDPLLEYNKIMHHSSKKKEQKKMFLTTHSVDAPLSFPAYDVGVGLWGL